MNYPPSASSVAPQVSRPTGGSAARLPPPWPTLADVAEALSYSHMRLLAQDHGQ